MAFKCDRSSARHASPRYPFPLFASQPSTFNSRPVPSRLTPEVHTHTLERLTMRKIIFGTIAEMAAGIREKKFSPVEVVDAHLERAAALQPKLNAFVHLDADGARKQARTAEAAVLRGDAVGPLHGVPLTIKSCIDAAGWPAPAGSLLRKDYVPQTRCAPCGAAACCRRDCFREYKYAGIFDGVRDRQFFERQDEQSMGCGAVGRWLERRRGRGDCIGLLGRRSGERRRRIDPCAGAFLRDLRIEADPGAHSGHRTFSRRRRRIRLDRSGRADGADRRGRARSV